MKILAGKSPTTMLKETFLETSQNFCSDSGLVNTLWTEIEKEYSAAHRHYHTLHHLDNLLKQLVEIKTKLKNPHSVMFSLYYHDVIYNVLRSDNEEKSAEFAEKRMKLLSVDAATIAVTKAEILATKSHSAVADRDTNYFTDADLSILGQSWEEYAQYYRNVRKEYSIYPDLLYIPGRKKVLKHFLSMDRIFKTAHFYQRLEKQARENLNRELEAY